MLKGKWVLGNIPWSKSNNQSCVSTLSVTIFGHLSEGARENHPIGRWFSSYKKNSQSFWKVCEESSCEMWDCGLVLVKLPIKKKLQFLLSSFGPIHNISCLYTNNVMHCLISISPAINHVYFSSWPLYKENPTNMGKWRDPKTHTSLIVQSHMAESKHMDSIRVHVLCYQQPQARNTAIKQMGFYAFKACNMWYGPIYDKLA